MNDVSRCAAVITIKCSYLLLNSAKLGHSRGFLNISVRGDAVNVTRINVKALFPREYAGTVPVSRRCAVESPSHFGAQAGRMSERGSPTQAELHARSYGHIWT